MLISVFSPKGGVGTSVSSALISKCLSKLGPTLLVETENGDLEAIVGADEVPKYSFSDWSHSAEPTDQSLMRISVNVVGSLDYVIGSIDRSNEQEDTTCQFKNMDTGFIGKESRTKLIDSISSIPGHCVVDCSLAASELQTEIVEASDVVVMVLRQCYLGLFKAMQHNLKNQIDVCIVVCESGRSISTHQIAETLGVGTVIELDARRDFARAIDAGVLLHRTPEKFIAPIESYVHDLNIESYENNVTNDIFQDSRTRNSNEFWDESNKTELSDREKFVFSDTYGRHVRTLLKESK